MNSEVPEFDARMRSIQKRAIFPDLHPTDHPTPHPQVGFFENLKKKKKYKKHLTKGGQEISKIKGGKKIGKNKDKEGKKV